MSDESPLVADMVLGFNRYNAQLYRHFPGDPSSGDILLDVPGLPQSSVTLVSALPPFPPAE